VLVKPFIREALYANLKRLLGPRPPARLLSEARAREQRV
jgi:hypothetical protein